MKKLLLIVIASTALLMMLPETASARWHFGFGAYYEDCDCYWGEPDPWDAWWECPCYWDIWEWCSWHPYWMWPRWCRRWVEAYYSPCGRYYYVYYDYFVPRSTRIYVDGRYRYRYDVPLGSSYNTTERIPRRSGLERPSGSPPRPETVTRTLENLGPEYRIKTVASHATQPTQSLRNSGSSVTPISPSRERPITTESILPKSTTAPYIEESPKKAVTLKTVPTSISSSVRNLSDGSLTITNSKIDKPREKDISTEDVIDIPVKTTVKSDNTDKKSYRAKKDVIEKSSKQKNIKGISSTSESSSSSSPRAEKSSPSRSSSKSIRTK
ncbi:hypothetical protein KAH81_03695 [bacterium]|nr:hypothetical protein [bacterium]